jgi:4-alpha-glucanotransferase
MAYSKERRSGVLLHINSLSGPGRIGTMGEESYRFIDLLSKAGQSIWQMLPIHPPDAYHNPYSALTAFGGNTQLTTTKTVGEHDERVFARWQKDNQYWIKDWALFKIIKKVHKDQPWYSWPKPLRDRQANALQDFKGRHAKRIDGVVREQYLFDREWAKLRAYASSKGVQLFGDLPIFVALDSADVWANRRLFNIGRNGRPTHVSGVPPDYFSRTGQRWGNPLYVWENHEEDGYLWWRNRLAVELRRFDRVRIDHFRAIEQYYKIPARHRTARRGRWVDGPGREFLKAMQKVAGTGRLVAEDLGIITPSIIALRHAFKIPGMAVLHFAFDSISTKNNPHHPDNMAKDVICYPGTHDNETTVSWFDVCKNAREPHLVRRRKRVQALMREGEEVQNTLVRTAFESRANTAIVSMQDLLGLDNRARMNTPGRREGNWRWRMRMGQLERVDWKWLEALTRRTNRSR